MNINEQILINILCLTCHLHGLVYITLDTPPPLPSVESGLEMETVVGKEEQWDCSDDCLKSYFSFFQAKLCYRSYFVIIALKHWR